MSKMKDRYFDKINNNDDSGYEKYMEELSEKRFLAERHIIDNYDKTKNIKELFEPIWHASTKILPHLEVQVVIDANRDIHVSTGTAGYVDFQINPIGMKLPVECWIHTHPFGVAYFSGTDIGTVRVWQPIMKEAYVLGGVEHYGHWTQDRPNALDIFHNNEYEETQVWNRRGEEE